MAAASSPRRSRSITKTSTSLIYAGHFLTSIFELEVDGRKERVLPRDYQLDVVTDRPVHVDFLRLLPGSHVRIGIPVHVANREASPRIEKGRRWSIWCCTRSRSCRPADDIPESITIDLAGMDFHDPVHVSALKLPEGCRPLSGTAEMTVVTAIVPPTVMVEETPAAAAAAAPATAGAAAAAPAARRSSEGRRRQGRLPRRRKPRAVRPLPAKPAAKKWQPLPSRVDRTRWTGAAYAAARRPRHADRSGDPMLVIAGPPAIRARDMQRNCA